jgi:hypothetical protein
LKRAGRLIPRKKAAKAGTANKMSVNIKKSRLSIDLHTTHSNSSANEPNKTKKIPYNRIGKGFSNLLDSNMIINRSSTKNNPRSAPSIALGELPECLYQEEAIFFSEVVTYRKWPPELIQVAIILSS